MVCTIPTALQTCHFAKYGIAEMGFCYGARGGKRIEQTGNIGYPIVNRREWTDLKVTNARYPAGLKGSCFEAI